MENISKIQSWNCVEREIFAGLWISFDSPSSFSVCARGWWGERVSAVCEYSIFFSFTLSRGIDEGQARQRLKNVPIIRQNFFLLTFFFKDFNLFLSSGVMAKASKRAFDSSSLFAFGCSSKLICSCLLKTVCGCLHNFFFFSLLSRNYRFFLLHRVEILSIKLSPISFNSIM